MGNRQADDLQAIERLADSIEAGRPLSSLADVADPGTRLLLAVGITTGAPLRDVLARLRDVSIARTLSDDEIDSSLAGPRLARRIVLALPGVSVLIGIILGFDPLSVLFGTAVGWACLVGGLIFVWSGQRWMRRLEARARDFPRNTGLEYEALALAMSAGMPLNVALGVVGRTVEISGLAVGEVLTRSRYLGAPVVEQLRRHAQASRQSLHQARLRAARELGERILVPMGACLLPAFLLWAVVPVTFSMMRGVSLGS